MMITTLPPFCVREATSCETLEVTAISSVSWGGCVLLPPSLLLPQAVRVSVMALIRSGVIMNLECMIMYLYVCN